MSNGLVFVVFVGLAVSCSGGKPGLAPAGDLLSFALLNGSKQRSFFGVLVGLALFFSGGKPGLAPAGELLFFASPKKSNQKKGEPRPCRFAVPCATRSVRGRAKLASLRQRPPLSERCSVAQHGLMAGGYLSARPLRGPRPNGLFASLTLRGAGVSSFLYPHFSQGHGTPCHYSPLLVMGNHKSCPYAHPHSSHITPRPSKTAAEPKLRHSARSRGIHVPLHSNLDAATTRSMTACAGQRCPPSPTPFPVIPRSVAESLAHQNSLQEREG